MSQKSSTRAWNVRVHRNGVSKHLGVVYELNEDLARCAAIWQFGVHPEESTPEEMANGIGPNEDFDVTEAST